MNKILSWGLFCGILLFFLFLVVPLFLLAFFNHPAADDFCNAQRVREFGWIGSQSWLYMHWTGRYVSNAWIGFVFWLTLASRIGWTVVYKFGPIFLISLLTASVFWLVQVVYLKTMTFLNKLAISLLFVSAYLLMVPSLNESFYWVTSAFIYEVGVVFLLILFGLLGLMVRTKNTRKIAVLTALSAAIVVTVVASYEVTMLGLMTMLGLSLIGAYIFRKPYRRPLLILFVVAILAAGGDLVAPGNNVRMAYFPHSRDLIFSVTKSFISTVGLFFEVSRQSIFWMATLVFLSLSPFKKSGRPVLVLLATVIVVASMFFSTYWSTGGFPPARAVGVILAFLLAGWFLTVSNLRIRVAPVVGIAALGLLTLYSAFYNRNVRSMYADILTGSARNYSQQLDQRDIAIEKGKKSGVTDFVFQSLKSYPTSLYFSDIEADPLDWKNRCAANYFGVKSVRIAP